ncbi:MAG: acetyl-CoA C-acyltransferase [Bacteroidota bacterium]
MNPVYIVAAKRTPLGSFGGSLSSLSATELGAQSVKSTIESLDVGPLSVDEVLYGNVCQANLGQAPARQIAIGAGISHNVPCTTINKVCSSGMKAVMFGAQSIMLAQHDVVVCGGVESMSNVPFYLPHQRWGTKYGHQQTIDGLQKDGLTDAYNHQAMGNSGDLTAAKYGFSREEQDAYAVQSYHRAAKATDDGAFQEEIAAVLVPQRKGDDIVVSKDEEYLKVNFDKIPKLRPAFSKEGTVTAANASTLNDGAATIILMSEKAVKEYDVTPLAQIMSFADAAHEPEWFTTAPSKAAPIATKRAGFSMSDIDLYEVNEAFAVVPMAFAQSCELDMSTINVHGGAVSLGHPLGCSGARIITTLVHALRHHNQTNGLATLCNGGGGASAIVIKRLH